MQISRPRFSMRRMMIAVAILAVVIWSVQLYRLSVYYDSRASHFLRKEKQSQIDFQFWSSFVDHEKKKLATASKAIPNNSAEKSPELADENSRTLRQYDNMLVRLKNELDYHVSLKEKYKEASRHPWLPVPPDPPDPNPERPLSPAN